MPEGRHPSPLILGVNRTQDASICLMRGSEVVFSIQKERLSREKHHWGKLDDFRNVYHRLVNGVQGPIDVVVEGYSSDREFDSVSTSSRS